MSGKKVFVTLLAVSSLFATCAFAEDRATLNEAKATVKRAVADYKANASKTLADITAPSKAYVSKDLYLVAYDMSGKCIAHGSKADRVGKDLMGEKDADGKLFIKERIEKAKSADTFWQNYKFNDPATKKILPKSAYCEKADAKTVICGGVYFEEEK